MSVSFLRQQLVHVSITIVLFLGMLWINDRMFERFEFVPGINWFYLPAGVRLLCTLMFEEAGAIGLLAVSWYVSYAWFFPSDPDRAFVGGIVATVAPYAVFLGARRFYGLGATLRHLTPAKLLVLAIAYSVASPLLHHLWFAWRGQEDLLRGFAVMFIGDLNGCLLMLYGLKAMLWLMSRREA
jgi:hypothetical protein